MLYAVHSKENDLNNKDPEEMIWLLEAKKCRTVTEVGAVFEELELPWYPVFQVSLLPPKKYIYTYNIHKHIPR